MAGWAGNYITSDQLKAYVRIPDGADDTQLGLAVAAASRAVDRATRRQFGVVEAPVARYYTPRLDTRSGRWVVDIDDLQDDEGVAVAVDTAGDGSYSTAVTTYVLGPRNAVADGTPWTQLTVTQDGVELSTAQESVRVTAAWGWATVPEQVQQACLLQASRLFARRTSPFGVAGSPDAGTEIRLLARLDPDVEVALRGLKRNRWRVA